MREELPAFCDDKWGPALKPHNRSHEQFITAKETYDCVSNAKPLERGLWTRRWGGLIGLEETGSVWGTSSLNHMWAKRLMSDLESKEDQ